jgi:hypothetical protein
MTEWWEAEACASRIQGGYGLEAYDGCALFAKVSIRVSVRWND